MIGAVATSHEYALSVEISGFPEDHGEYPEYIAEVLDELTTLTDAKAKWRHGDLSLDGGMFVVESCFLRKDLAHSLQLQCDYDGPDDVADVQWNLTATIERRIDTPPAPNSRVDEVALGVTFVAACGAAAAIYVTLASWLIALIIFVAGVFLAFKIAAWIDNRRLVPWREEVDRLRSNAKPVAPKTARRFFDRIQAAIAQHPATASR